MGSEIGSQLKNDADELSSDRSLSTCNLQDPNPCTSRVDHEVPVIGTTIVKHKKVMLLSFGDGKVPVLLNTRKSCCLVLEMGNFLCSVIVPAFLAWQDAVKWKLLSQCRLVSLMSFNPDSGGMLRS